ncbi:MAG TPA: hypothetical protein VMF89_02010, partial [Polyangiales bacterium]|nr:hypothetical protein [Polyangiales bacterium]
MDKAKVAAALAVATLTSGSFLVGRSFAVGVPTGTPLVYSGVLEDPDGPINGERNIEIKLWGKGEDELCTTRSQPITLVNGRFSMDLPQSCVEAIDTETNV